jgi:hypothetical protein
MFGYQLGSGTCGCNCSSNACVQEKLYAGFIGSGGTSCASADNIRAWFNNSANDPSPGWSAEPSGWQIDWQAQWDTPSDTDPDDSTIEGPSGGVIASGATYPPGSQIVAGSNPECEKVAFLLPASTAYIVGVWCSGAEEPTSPFFQQACIMSGTPEGDCYQYDIPVPPASLCDGGCTVGGFAGYLLIPISDYGGWFGQTWDGFVSGCASGHLEYPCVSGLTTSPGACLSPDPFFGSDP